ncbi:MAG: energy-coupling factor ABC transporter ATP-binding protein [Treponema sp.]|nr:energy-coupling factor ABC transporter ATP-binding protein [Treponema sp.]
MGESKADAVRIEGLGYSFEADPRRPVLDDVNLAFGENEFTAILGRNGSGKTTLLKNIAGLLRPSRGRVLVRGRDTEGMGVAEIAGQVGYVMQDSDNQLFEQTVYDEVAFALRRPRKKRDCPEVRRKVEEALETLGLQDRRDDFPPALCKADRVRTVFAAVLAMGAKILILDEPLAGQDRGGSRVIMETLDGLHRKGHTLILVTHDIRVAAGHAGRLVVMGSGRVRLDGDPPSVFERAQELAEAGVLLPPVARLSRELRGRIPIRKTASSPMELALALRDLG